MPLQPSNSRRGPDENWTRWATLVALSVCLGSGIGALVVRRIAALSVIAPTINEDEYAARELAYKSHVYSRDATRGSDTVAAALRAFDRYPELLSRPEFAATGIAAAMHASPFDVLRGHTENVSHAAFSADDSHIVTTSWDKTARVWDASTGKLLVTLFGHAGRVNHAAFSPNFQVVATASADGTARVWDLASGTVAATLNHEGGVNQVAFSPDGALVLTASSDGSARLWRATDGNHLLALLGHAVPVVRAVFAPDGSSVATAADDGSTRIWDVSNGECRAVLLGKDGQLSYLGYTPNGKSVVTATRRSGVRFWDAKSGRVLGSQTVSGVSSVSMDAAGRPIQFVAFSEGKDAYLWDVTGKGWSAILRGHGGAISTAAFSGSGQSVVTSSDDGTARVWTPSQSRFTGYLVGHAGPVLDVAFSPDGTRVLSASEDRTVRIWETVSGRQLATCEHPMPVTRAVFSPDGTRVYTRAGDGIARAFIAVSCVVERAIPIRFSCRNDTPDCLRAQVLISDLLPAELQRNGSTKLKVALSPDDSLAAIATDNMVEVRSMPSWSIVSRFGSEGSTVSDVQFSPDGSQFVTSYRDGSAEVRDMSSGVLALTVRDRSPNHERQYARELDCSPLEIDAPTDPGMLGGFAPGSRRILTHWESPSPAKIWDTGVVRPQAYLVSWIRDCSYFSVPYFNRPTFTADGSHVVATWGPTANLWFTGTGKRVATIPWVLNAAISPNGLHIVTTGLSLAPRLLPATALGGAHAACAYVKAAHWSLPEQYRDLPGICDRLPKQ